MRIRKYIRLIYLLANLLGCSSFQARISESFHESPQAIDACFAYLSGNRQSLSSLISNFSEDDRSIFQDSNEMREVIVPVFSYDDFSGRGGLYISYDGRVQYPVHEKKKLYGTEIIEWKCVERIRIKVDELFLEALTIYTYYPNNTSAMFLRIEEASDLYRKLSRSVPPNSDFLRGYLYFGLANQLNQRNSSYPFACSLFKEAKGINLELTKKTFDKKLILASFQIVDSLLALERNSRCL